MLRWPIRALYKGQFFSIFYILSGMNAQAVM